MSEDIKVTDAETLDWMSRLSQQDKETLKLRALERRAVELLQPKPAPDFSAMTEQQIADYCRRGGRDDV